MSKVTLDTVIDHLLAALKEGLDGPGKWGFFSDSGPEAGLAATLKALSASEASRVTGGTSIAAHAYHLVFSLNATVLYMNGDTHAAGLGAELERRLRHRAHVEEAPGRPQGRLRGDEEGRRDAREDRLRARGPRRRRAHPRRVPPRRHPAEGRVPEGDEGDERQPCRGGGSRGIPPRPASSTACARPCARATTACAPSSRTSTG